MLKIDTIWKRKYLTINYKWINKGEVGRIIIESYIIKIRGGTNFIHGYLATYHE